MKIAKKVIAIVLAAGQGSRMNSDIHKQYMLLNEKPVLYYCLSTFEQSSVDEVVLVVGQGETEYCKNAIVKEYNFNKVKTIVEGGKERWQSVYKGLSSIVNCSYVLIHDGARPFITLDIVEKSIETVVKYSACVVGMPVKDTIKIANPDGFCDYTPNRSLTWLIQTPQSFEFTLIKEAYDKLNKEARMFETSKSGTSKGCIPKGSLPFITDDAMVVETYMNHSVYLVEGSYKNIKITTPEDLEIATLFAVK